jgi:hypothetical protein
MDNFGAMLGETGRLRLLHIFEAAAALLLAGHNVLVRCDRGRSRYRHM